MQTKKIFMVAILLTGFMLTGFSCSSSNLTGARLYIQQKNYDKALASLKKEVAANPKSDEGYYLMGYVYSLQNKVDEMLDAFNKSLAISPKYQKEITSSKTFMWANSFNLGVKSFQKGNTASTKDSAKIFYDRSIESFKTAIKIEPDSINTHRNLAFVLLNSQKYDEAIAPLKMIIAKRNSKDGYRFLGNIYYLKAKNLKSKFTSTKNPKDSVAYMDMFNKAIKVLEAGKKAYPNDSNILLELSNSYIGAQKSDVAINAFKEGVKRQPGNKYYHYNYGVLLLNSKKYSEAIEQFKAAEKIDPNYENALYNLGVVYVQWGDEIMKSDEDKDKNLKSDKYKIKYEAALPYLERVIQLNSKDASIWETLGKVYTRLGKTNDAENAFNKADSLR